MSTKLVWRLSDATGLPPGDVERIISTAEYRYKVFPIAKRSGGTRWIAQPSRELKTLQGLVIAEMSLHLPIHSAVHSYIRGRGIRSNAQPHIQSSYLLKVDFKDFFPSVHVLDLTLHLQKFAPNAYSADEVVELSKMLFWIPGGKQIPRLSIGAPSSPFISNSLLFDIDSAIAEAASSIGAIYTRYADDLSISSQTPHALDKFQDVLRKILSSVPYPRLRLNRKKTVFASKRGRRVVTGLVLNSVNDLSLGRERKKLIRVMAYKKSLGQLSADDLKRLRGYLAFAKDIEPRFVQSLIERLPSLQFGY